MSAVLEENQEPQIETQYAVTLLVPKEVRQSLVRNQGAVALAESFEIDCAEIAQLVADNMNTCKQAHAAIDKARKHILEPAKLTVERINEVFKPTLAALEQAEGIYKAKLVAWNKQEADRIAKEKAEREAEQRRIQQEADRKAAEERAKADAIAKQQEEKARQEREAKEKAEREAREAAEAERKAKEAGDKEAQRIAAEQRKEAEARQRQAAQGEAAANEKANAAIENGEAKARDVQLQATAVVAAAAPPPVATRIAGTSARKNWIAELEPGKTEDDVKLLVVTEIVQNNRTELLALLNLDLAAANRMAKTFENHTRIPGMKARNAEIVAGRKA